MSCRPRSGWLTRVGIPADVWHLGIGPRLVGGEIGPSRRSENGHRRPNGLLGVGAATDVVTVGIDGFLVGSGVRATVSDAGMGIATTLADGGVGIPGRRSISGCRWMLGRPGKLKPLGDAHMDIASKMAEGGGGRSRRSFFGRRTGFGRLRSLKGGHAATSNSADGGNSATVSTACSCNRAAISSNRRACAAVSAACLRRFSAANIRSM